MGEATSFESFESFAIEVRSHQWVLKIEPAFQLEDDVARFMWPPYKAELELIAVGRVRVALSVEGQLVRTVEYDMSDASAKLIADGIMAVFEPDEG
ncbi:MAG TPA: hypothetical protein VGU66_08965 [Candidatus Elarobacter sp.]|nr:hypothetical protein [Candidatus Elarobacter sp.]